MNLGDTINLNVVLEGCARDYFVSYIYTTGHVDIICMERDVRYTICNFELPIKKNILIEKIKIKPLEKAKIKPLELDFVL